MDLFILSIVKAAIHVALVLLALLTAGCNAVDNYHWWRAEMVEQLRESWAELRKCLHLP